MRFSSFGRLGAVAILGAFTALTPLAAHADPAVRTITVSGDGDITGVPDQAQLSAGVATIARTAEAALAANARKMTAVFDALKKMGVPEPARSKPPTSRFSRSTRRIPRGEPQRISGYQVSNQIDVALDDNKKLGPVLDTLIGSRSQSDQLRRFRHKKPGAVADEGARSCDRRRACQSGDLCEGGWGDGSRASLSINENGGGMPQCRPGPYAHDGRAHGIRRDADRGGRDERDYERHGGVRDQVRSQDRCSPIFSASPSLRGRRSDPSSDPYVRSAPCMGRARPYRDRPSCRCCRDNPSHRLSGAR